MKQLPETANPTAIVYNNILGTYTLTFPSDTHCRRVTLTKKANCVLILYRNCCAREMHTARAARFPVRTQHYIHRVRRYYFNILSAVETSNGSEHNRPSAGKRRKSE